MTKAFAEPYASGTAVERGSEHVLVVEDDDLVRSHVVRQVISLGYQVSEAADGPAGLDIIRERTDINLLFTDLVMTGGMSGYDLAEAAEHLRPDLRLLFTSGHSKDSIGYGNWLDHSFELLQKPYRRQELAQRLRKVLEN